MQKINGFLIVLTNNQIALAQEGVVKNADHSYQITNHTSPQDLAPMHVFHIPYAIITNSKVLTKLY
jgi:hypothetical protein